jgi:hypothetical protein
MAIQYFNSGNYGAPTLINTTTGSLVSGFDLILLSGYGSQVPTSVTRVGTTVTVVVPVAHALEKGQMVRIEGATQTEYNGDFYLTSVTANSYSFEIVGSPVTPATGSITAKVSPAIGWTRPYNATNKAVYRYPGGSQGYLFIEDLGTNYARGWLAETASDINTYTAKCPAEVSLSGGIYINKPSTGLGTEGWSLITSPKNIIFIPRSTSYVVPFIAGDLIPTDPADPNVQFVWGCIGTSYFTGATQLKIGTSYYDQSVNGCMLYMSNKYGGVNTPATCLAVVPSYTVPVKMGTNSSPIPYPSPYLDRIKYTPVYMGDPAGIRGRIPGIFHQLQNDWLLPNRTLFNGGGTDTGKSFRYFYTAVATQVTVGVREGIIVDVTNMTDWS